MDAVMKSNFEAHMRCFKLVADTVPALRAVSVSPSHKQLDPLTVFTLDSLRSTWLTAFIEGVRHNATQLLTFVDCFDTVVTSKLAALDAAAQSSAEDQNMTAAEHVHIGFEYYFDLFQYMSQGNYRIAVPTISLPSGSTAPPISFNYVSSR